MCFGSARSGGLGIDVEEATHYSSVTICSLRIKRNGGQGQIRRPLSRMHARSKTTALQMFDHIRKYIAATNNEEDTESRSIILEDIKSSGLRENERELKVELFLQLFKQTQDCPSLTIRRNAWQLIDKITTEEQPPQALRSKSVQSDCRCRSWRIQ